MNKQAINTLATLLEDIPMSCNMGFNMGDYHTVTEYVAETHVPHECGTVACIAGWSALWQRMDGKGLLKQARQGVGGDEHSVAEEILGLDGDQADDLFLSDTGSNITPKMAAKVLRNLADTGQVDWTVAYQEAV